MSSCSVCTEPAKRNNTTVQCRNCFKVFHVKCLNDDAKGNIQATGNNLQWKCSDCSKAPVSDVFVDASDTETFTIADVISHIKGLDNTMKLFKTEINKSIEFVSESVQENTRLITDQSKKLEAYEQKIQALESEISSLRNENAEMKSKLNESEQYSRANCVEIHGVPVLANESCISVVQAVGQAIHFPIDRKMIDDCHRLPTKPGGTPPIILKFVSRLDKWEFLNKRKVKKNLSTRHMPEPYSKLNNPAPVYINENLTSANRVLLAKAREKKKTLNFRFCWTKNGRIFVRQTEKSKVIAITSEDDLHKMDHDTPPSTSASK